MLKFKKLLASVLCICMLLTFASALTAEEENTISDCTEKTIAETEDEKNSETSGDVNTDVVDTEDEILEGLIKQNAEYLTCKKHSSRVDYTKADAFDNFTVTKHFVDDRRIIFSFDCKAKSDMSGNVRCVTCIENYAIWSCVQSEFAVYDRINQKVYTFAEPEYDLTLSKNGLITTKELEYLYQNCCDKEYEGDYFPRVENNDINRSIDENIGSLLKKAYGEDLYADFEGFNSYVLFENEDINIIKIDFLSAGDVVSSWPIREYMLDKYYFINIANTEYCVYDNATGEVCLLDDAYNDGVVNTNMLEEISQNGLRNDVYKAQIKRDGEYIKPPVYVTEEVKEKICNAIKKCGMKIFCEQQYYSDEELYDPSYVVNTIYCVHFAYEFDGNYVISFSFDDICVDGCSDEVIGNYMVDYDSITYGVYSEKDDKLYSVKEAYENGILTDVIMYDIWKTQAGKSRYENFISRVGDINRDGEIDVVDIAKCRNAIITGEYFEGCHSYLSLCDMNGDGAVDIVDVALMRHYVINGEENGFWVLNTELETIDCPQKDLIDRVLAVSSMPKAEVVAYFGSRPVAGENCTCVFKLVSEDGLHTELFVGSVYDSYDGDEIGLTKGGSITLFDLPSDKEVYLIEPHCGSMSYLGAIGPDVSEDIERALILQQTAELTTTQPTNPYF